MTFSSKKFLFAAVFVAASLILGGQALAAPSVQTTPATNITQNSVQLNGYIVPTGSYAVYWFEYGQNGSLAQMTTQQSANYLGGQTPVSNTIYGLAQNATYSYRLVAQDQFGTSYGQVLSFTTGFNNGGGYGQPAVETLSATNVFANGATLNGRVNMQGGYGTYWFEYGQTPSFGQTTAQQSLSNTGYLNVSAPIGTFNSFGGTYYYRLVAQNQYGTVYGQTLSFVMNGNNNGGSGTFQAPTVQTIANGGSGAGYGVMQAQVNPNGSPTTIWFQYGRTQALGAMTPRQDAGSGTSNFSDTVTLRGLSGGTTYYYRAVAQNQYGTNYGQTASFTTSGVAPTGGSTGGSTGGHGSSGSGSGSTGGNAGGSTGGSGTPVSVVTSTPAAAPGCFTVSPTISSSQLKGGDTFTYSLTYHNGCGQTFTNGTLHVTLPAAVDFASTNYPFLSRDGNVITYSLGTIAANIEGAVTVSGQVKDQVNSGDSLIFQANIDYTDPRGSLQTASSYLAAAITAGGASSGTDNGTSTLGASTADALSGLFHSGWFWLVLFLILIALFIFWLASRRRSDEEDEEDVHDAEMAHAH